MRILLTVICFAIACNSAFAKECTDDGMAAEIKEGIASRLNEINPDLKMDSLIVVRQKLFEIPGMKLNVAFFDYEVTVADKNGKKFSLATYSFDRTAPSKRIEKVGGLVMSGVFVTGQDDLILNGDGEQIGRGSASRCEAQYLSLTSFFWFENHPTHYTTVLEDAQGNQVSLNQDADIFDRALRAISVELN